MNMAMFGLTKTDLPTSSIFKVSRRERERERHCTGGSIQGTIERTLIVRMRQFSQRFLNGLNLLRYSR